MPHAPQTLSQGLLRIWEKTYFFIFAALVGLAIWASNTYGGAAVVRAGGAVFALVGLACLGYAWRAVEHARRSSGWRPVEARILKSEVAERRESGGRSVYMNSPTRTPVTFYTPDVVYEYDVDGLTYRSGSVLVANVNRSRAEAEATVARYPAGARATAWVDPGNPRTAVLERDAEANRGACVTAAIVGAIFTVLGLAVWALVR